MDEISGDTCTEELCKDDVSNCEYCNNSFWDFAQDVNSLTEPEWEIEIKTIVLALLTIIGLLGNLSIMIIITKNKLLRLQPTNLFLLNMAVADFLTLLIIPVLFYYKQDVIFRFYKLGKVPCVMTPFLIVTFFLSGALSLMVISLNRLCGIVFPNVQWLRLRRKTVIAILVGIWIVSVAFAGPTLHYRRYFTRQWSDLLEANCEDSLNTKGKDKKEQFKLKCEFEIGYNSYWFSILTINVWIPTLVMFVCYAVIFFKIKQSMRAFPYLSEQSRITRSRSNVIRMLFVLFLVQVICWGPWQFHVVFDAYVWYSNEENKQCFVEDWGSFNKSDAYFESPINSAEPQSDLITNWKAAETIVHDVKFFFIFANSALNPIIYGYCNETMRKAFRITFTCLFRDKPKFILQRGGAAGYSKFYFSKTEKNIKDNPVAKSIFTIGNTVRAPALPNGQQLAHPKSENSRIGYLARRVVTKTSENLKMRKQSPKRPVVKSPSEGYVSQIEWSQNMTTNPGSYTTSLMTSGPLTASVKKVSFVSIVDTQQLYSNDHVQKENTELDGTWQQDSRSSGILNRPNNWMTRSKFFRKSRDNTANYLSHDNLANNSQKGTSRNDFVQNKLSQISATNNSSHSSMGIEVNCEVDIKVNVTVIDHQFQQQHKQRNQQHHQKLQPYTISTQIRQKVNSKQVRRCSDPGPKQEFHF